MDTDYRKFTKPAELHKAINTLRGIVAGITLDNEISPDETTELAHWCIVHSHLKDRHPFKELIPVVEKCISDGVIDEEESKDILWFCNNFVSSNESYYDFITSSLQFLTGLIHGILADNIITDNEIRALQHWIDANESLRGYYPFDEIDALLIKILSDGKIDDEERNVLKAFLGEFVDISASYNININELNELRKQYNVDGICAAAPEITFENKTFCFTGESTKASRLELEIIIASRNGIFRNNVSKKTNYLVVGNNGNPCWAYSCYGRKIEEAMKLRKSGAKIIIVNEIDFWDALDWHF